MTSTSTTSASSLSAMRRAQLAPMLPAPTTVIFFRNLSSFESVETELYRHSRRPYNGGVRCNRNGPLPLIYRDSTTKISSNGPGATVPHRAGTRKRYRAYRRRNRGPGQAGSERAASPRTGAAGASIGRAVAAREAPALAAWGCHGGTDLAGRSPGAESQPKDQTRERTAGILRRGCAARHGHGQNRRRSRAISCRVSVY